MILEKIYSRPYRVYLCFALLITVGIICYHSMSVALFPNSSRPKVHLWIPYDSYTKESFLNIYGKTIEGSLSRLQTLTCQTEEVTAKYEDSGVNMEVLFSWGNQAIICQKEVEQVMTYFKSQWPDNMRYGSFAHLDSQSLGYFLGSFYSDKRSAEEIHSILDDLISPRIVSLPEVSSNFLYNPSQTQIAIILDPLKMASFKLLPDAVSSAVQNSVKSYNGGIIHNNEQTIIVEVSPQVKIIEHLGEILIPTAKNQAVVLSEIAELILKENVISNQIFKVNGESSIILYATPVVGKNIKAMSDKILAIVNQTLQLESVPADIKFVTLINPGAYIKASIANVMHEVWLCSLIAVIILFVFIGSISGTLTALIEIPISIILSFILMKITNIQLNLISLGGLALSVGMNVDASIVVIDAIIKKMNNQAVSDATAQDIVHLVVQAVREVFTPVILATITSLIVFLPLIFTSQLTYAILGDLAKTVIYSHGLSMIIALVLVPTIRIHLAGKIGITTDQHRIPGLQHFFEKIYDFYRSSLLFFLQEKKLRKTVYLSVLLSIIISFLFIPQRLNREIISAPDTHITNTSMYFAASSHINDMEVVVAKYEELLQNKYEKEIDFIFSQINQTNTGATAIVLRDKKKFNKIFRELQELTKGSTEVFYVHSPFNHSELPIPTPPDWRIEFVSSDTAQANKVIEHFRLDLLESGIVENINLNILNNNKYLVKPFTDIMQKIQQLNPRVQPADVGKMLTLSNKPLQIAKLTLNNRDKDIVLLYPEKMFNENFAIQGIPVPVGDKVVPIRALAEFDFSPLERTLVRVDGANVFRLEGYFTEKEKDHSHKILTELKQFTADFRANTLKNVSDAVSINMVDAKVELTKAMDELLLTTLISLVLIFLVLYLRFASVIHSLIIMLAIPFGILGVILALWIFQSTISLNSALGIILLNGIAVANSIMLVDKILKHVASGVEPMQAILLTSKQRIRPILMTSIITILGMLPIALGFGAGGKVLQPLGIAVSGGLWVSLIFTLYIIPALELRVLTKWQNQV